MNQETPTTLDPLRFRFWHPAPGASIEIGAERQVIALPALNLPLLAGEELPPNTDAIGNGLYDYLRQFPDCAHNRAYAALLRDAFPHLIADLASQAIMLEHKEVEAPYLRRKINALKILALLDADNGALHQLIGIACYDLAMEFRELLNCHDHLAAALRSLQLSDKLLPNQAKTLNYLGQVNFLLGDNPMAAGYFNQTASLLSGGTACDALHEKAASLLRGEAPAEPPVIGLERIGQALADCAAGEWGRAATNLESLDTSGFLTDFFPNPEVLALLARCQAHCGDPGLALATLERALALDPDCESARSGRSRLLAGEEWR